MDGRKSFIFSWNKKHRLIHEEALRHYFDPTKKGQKFEYQPKQEGRSKIAQSPSPRYPLQKTHSLEEPRGEDRSFIRSYSVGQKGQDTSSCSAKSGGQRADDSSLSRLNSTEQRGEGNLFSRSNSVGQKGEYTSFSRAESVQQRRDDSSCGLPNSAGQGTEYGTFEPTTARLSSERIARPKEMPASSTERKG